METKPDRVKHYASYLQRDIHWREIRFSERGYTSEEVAFGTATERDALSVLNEWIKDQERAISSVREEESTEEVLNA